MIEVWAQWQSEFMTVLLGDFEEELRRMPKFRDFDSTNSARFPAAGNEHEDIGVEPAGPR